MIDKRILDLDLPAQEVIASDQKRLVVDAFTRYRVTDPLRFFQSGRQHRGRQSAPDVDRQLDGAHACWPRRPSPRWCAPTAPR